MPSNTTRIAKNTLALYFRQILIILVSLYTVRVVLEMLGTENYGTYNVVAGVVILFSFLNEAMTNATQRFLNFALGQNNKELARKVYSVSFILHIFIAILVVILAETIGLWLFFTWLNIPSERQFTAFVVYQISIATTVINIIRVPYNAVIIAHEEMSFFALISVIESILKLAIVFLLSIILFDKLIVYAILVCIVGIIILFTYKLYCNSRFEVANLRFYKDKELFRQFAVFSGWSLFGGFANVSRDYGTNILVNIFHGVGVNAAMGIAAQVNLAVFQFVSNFQTAFKPQIVKSYAAKDYDYFMRLIFQTSKISFYLLLVFVLPLYINADIVLRIWLKNIPEYTIVFTQLILICSLVDAITGPFWMSIQATGNIKKYHIIGSCFVFANLPLSLLFLWLGFAPVWVLIVKTGLNILTNTWRIFFLSGKINLSVKNFFRKVIVPIFIITVISGLLTAFLHSLFIDLTALIISCIASTLSISCLVYFVGLNVQERVVLKNWVRSRILKKPLEFEIADIISSADSSVQKTYFYNTKSGKPMPLVVHLHEWGCGYKILPERPQLGALCKNAEYNYIFPDFRGSNNTPESCASGKVVSDIDDAIDFAIKKGNVDTNNIVIIGVSGGGHATLTMYLKSKHNIKYFSAWCPISDIEQWYYQTKYAGLKYYKDIEQVVGDSQNVQEMKNRSPMYMAFAENVERKNSMLEIYHGINDGYTGSVPSVHSIDFYNKMCGNTVSHAETLGIVSRSIKDNSTEFIGDRKLLYKKESENIGLYIFDGTHEMLIEYAFKRIKILLQKEK